jgi:hypothetical protein
VTLASNQPPETVVRAGFNINTPTLQPADTVLSHQVPSIITADDLLNGGLLVEQVIAYWLQIIHAENNNQYRHNVSPPRRMCPLAPAPLKRQHVRVLEMNVLFISNILKENTLKTPFGTRSFTVVREPGVLLRWTRTAVTHHSTVHAHQHCSRVSCGRMSSRLLSIGGV